MEGRCAVDTWAEFGSSGAADTRKLKFGNGTDVFLCTGRDEVYIFSAEKRKLKVVLQFPGPVTDLVQDKDHQLLYVACLSGVYCANLQSLLPSFSADASSSPAELKISSEFLCCSEEGVLSLLLVDSVLVTLSQRDTSWFLSLYSPPKLSASSRCELLSSFNIPLVSDVLRHDSEKQAGKRSRPVLLCVHSGDTTQPATSSSSSEAMMLEPLLFKLLFGIDATLAKSPVILCGLLDGRLCFLPLCLPASRLRVLHSLEQPVVFVGPSLVEGSVSGHAQCLVAVGELGRVVLIKVSKGGADGGGSTAAFITGCVPGPVMCGCVDKKCFYYSTGSDLLALDLSAGSCEQEEEAASRQTVTDLQRPKSLNVCRVIAMAEPTCNTAGEVQLLCLSVRGQLQSVTLPPGIDEASSSNGPSIQAGRSVRDVLSAIGNVCQRASVLKSAIKSKNQILKHLNEVVNISFLLMANTDSKDNLPIQEKLLRCRAVTSWSRLLQKDSLILTCALENLSPHVLERGWTLSLTVFPLCYVLSSDGENSSNHFTFPFHNLHPGETFEVSVPLASAGNLSFPVTVSCFLIFSLSSLLEDKAAELPGLQNSCVTLPLNTLTVDWLHSLQVDDPTSTYTTTTCLSHTAADPVQSFINSRQIVCRRRGEGGEAASKPEREKYLAKIKLSSELLKEVLLLKSSDLDSKQTVCVSLLGWLLSVGAGGVKRGKQEDKIPVRNSVIQARDPNHHTVKLVAKEINVREENIKKEESLVAVELHIESSSLAAVCGLHHAVLRRLQTLLQTAPQRAASTLSVRSLALRQALQRAERLLQQIQQSRVSGAFSAGVSSGQVTRSLLSAYRELRENPLLII